MPHWQLWSQSLPCTYELYAYAYASYICIYAYIWKSHISDISYTGIAKIYLLNRITGIVRKISFSFSDELQPHATKPNLICRE